MSLRNKIVKFCNTPRWTIGFIEEPLNDIVEGKPFVIHYIKHKYRDRWFADPFILDVNEKYIYVLVEEYYDPIHRGRIARLTIDRKSYQLLKSDSILELPTHLSFPFICRKDEKIYIFPENADGEGLGMYEFVDGKCIHVKTVSAEPLADAVITDVFDETFMFSTHLPSHNGKTLSIHRFENGKPIQYTSYTFENNIARNAGDWFRIGNKVYRPAQDCNETYGGAVIMQEVKRDGDTFMFKNILRITTTNAKYTTGLHTFNHYKGLSVVDVRGWRHIFVSKLFFSIQRMIKK